MLLSLATAIKADNTESDIPRELKLNYTTQTQLGLIGTEDLSCPGPWSQCHSLCCGLSCAMSDGDNVWSIMRIAT